MKILSARDFKSAKTIEGIYLTIGLTGVITISPAAVTKMQIQAGDRVIIAQDDQQEYHIGVCLKGSEDPDGFEVRSYNKGNALQFNAKSLVARIVADKDLALHPDKKKSMRLDINFNVGVKYKGVEMYQIITD